MQKQSTKNCALNDLVLFEECWQAASGLVDVSCFGSVLKLFVCVVLFINQSEINHLFVRLMPCQSKLNGLVFLWGQVGRAGTALKTLYWLTLSWTCASHLMPLDIEILLILASQLDTTSRHQDYSNVEFFDQLTSTQQNRSLFDQCSSIQCYSF